jgi:hypothetical protein
MRGCAGIVPHSSGNCCVHVLKRGARTRTRARATTQLRILLLAGFGACTGELLGRQGLVCKYVLQLVNGRFHGGTIVAVALPAALPVASTRHNSSF